MTNQVIPEAAASKRKRFPSRHFSLNSRIFGEALMTRTNTKFHVLRLTERIAIVWDRKAAK